MDWKPRYEYGTPVSELIERFRRLYTGAVYDVMDHMNLPYQALASDIKPIRPDMILAAPAFTLKGITDPVGNPAMRSRRINMFNDMKSLGCSLVDVRDCSGDTQVAHYGEMNGVVGRSCGVVGALVDGGCRDTGLLLKMDFPVFCRYLSPVEAFNRWSYYEWQLPVALRGQVSSAVQVNPGDFIFGDIDGVLVIPHDAVIEVLRKTEELADHESQARAEFALGADPVAVYKKYGKL